MRPPTCTGASRDDLWAFPRGSRPRARQATGLDYFGARYFSAAQGRFTTPDEFKGGIVDPFTGQQVGQPGPLPYADITDPQTLNKYAYVRNNPLRYIDPDGHELTPVEILGPDGKPRITYIDTRLVGRLQNFVESAEAQGVSFTFNNIFRTSEQQEGVATPYTHNVTGTSPHEAGVAFDINVKTSLQGTDLPGLTKIAGEQGSNFSPLKDQKKDPPHFQANDLITRDAKGRPDQKYRDLIKENQKSYRDLERLRKENPEEYRKRIKEVQ